MGRPRGRLPLPPHLTGNTLAIAVGARRELHIPGGHDTRDWINGSREHNRSACTAATLAAGTSTGAAHAGAGAVVRAIVVLTVIVATAVPTPLHVDTVLVVRSTTRIPGLAIGFDAPSSHDGAR